MSDAFVSAFELLQAIEGTESKESLIKEVYKVLSKFGVSNFSLAQLDPNLKHDNCTVKVIASKATTGWAKHYIENGYVRLDPFVPWVFQTTRSASWSDLEPNLTNKDQKKLFGEQKEFLPGDGLVIPIHGSNGPICVAVMNGADPDFSARARPTLRLIAYYFYEVLTELEEAEDDWQPKYSPLTHRQTECLRWVSQGKSDWEIGEILGISQGTAHRHVERAKMRLDVSTRMQAAMIAWKSGWMLT
jgi:LuxR family transcriptional regulator, quorum-sensing system regulator BjaR1